MHRRLCIAYKSIFEILITQLMKVGFHHHDVVYCIQKYLWNPDNTTPMDDHRRGLPLCIAYKSIFEILITQLAVKRMRLPSVVYCIQKYLWNPDNTTNTFLLENKDMLCIAYKSIFEILITQPGALYRGSLPVVYCIQKYLWNPDNTTMATCWLSLWVLCIAYKSIFEILITQPKTARNCCAGVVYCIQKYLWNPDNTTDFVFCAGYLWHITKVRIKKRRRFISSAFLFLLVFTFLKKFQLLYWLVQRWHMFAIK